MSFSVFCLERVEDGQDALKMIEPLAILELHKSLCLSFISLSVPYRYISRFAPCHQ